MPPRWSPERLQEEIVLLGRGGLPRGEYFAELALRLRRAIANDATCWHTLDPYTRLLTSDAPHELIEHGVFTPETAPAAGDLIVRSEYLVPDTNTFASLASHLARTLRPTVNPRSCVTMDIAALADLLHETSERHDAFESVAPAHDWWDWYAAYMDARSGGSTPDEGSAAANRYMAEVKNVVVPGS